MRISIGGASRAGKTFLAKELSDFFRNDGYRVGLLHLDDFRIPRPEIPLIRNRVDWESPVSMDFKRIEEKIIEESEQNEIVIAEGNLIYFNEHLVSLFDKKLFISIEKATFQSRRNSDKRYGYVPKWYIEHVWESYLKFGQLTKEVEKEALIIDGNSTFRLYKSLFS